MERILKLVKENELLQKQIDDLQQHMMNIEEEMQHLLIEEKSKEYENELRMKNPDMWFKVDSIYQGDYIHITKIINTFGTDLIRGVRRVQVEIDRRVSFGSGGYIKVGVDTEVCGRCYDEESLNPVKLDDIKAEMAETLTKQIESLETL